MADYKLGLNVHGENPLEQIKILHRCGFRAFFTHWDTRVRSYRALADRLGMTYQSIHAPFDKIKSIWENSESADEGVRQLKSCVDDCSENAVPILVVHAFAGWDFTLPITRESIDKFRQVVDYAGEKSVKIAFENLQGVQHLKALLEAFREHDNVGLCWDSGHQHCYHPSTELLPQYADRLMATHLNDNLGITDPTGTARSTDDLHLLPFDGNVDWRRAAEQLKKCTLPETLMFELKRSSHLPLHGLSLYDGLDPETYISQCYAAACKFADLLQTK